MRYRGDYRGPARRFTRYRESFTSRKIRKIIILSSSQRICTAASQMARNEEHTTRDRSGETSSPDIKSTVYEISLAEMRENKVDR